MTPLPKEAPRVLFPQELMAQKPEGPLYGYFHPETRTANVLSCGAPPQRPKTFAPARLLGWLGPKPEGSTGAQNGEGGEDQAQDSPGPNLEGRWSEDGLQFKLDHRPCRIEFYSLTQDVFSRNTGILEVARMLDKRVLVMACGSVGSLLALEFARAGVGNFLLVDPDTLEYHNLCRHQCSVTDVGRFKVDALKDRILDINPAASVQTQKIVIQRLPKEVFDDFLRPGTLVLASGDNREADLYANRISCLYKVPFLSIGLWERAFAGEIFYSLPGETACYKCLYDNMGFNGGRVSENRRIYTTKEHLEDVRFEPGISTDLSLVSLIGAKVAYDLLDGTRHVLDHMTQYTLWCNSLDPEVGGEMVEIFTYPFQVTRSIEVAKNEDCPHCKIVGAALA